MASATVALALLVSLAASADFLRQLTSDHFLITYESGQGPGAVSGTYARSVQDGLEAAYETLVTQNGFAIFPGRIVVEIVETVEGEMGAEYVEHSADGKPHPFIEIATEDSMEQALLDTYLDASVEQLVHSTAAHELFHVIQDYYALQGHNDVTELAFVEGHATAVQELVFPDVNDYLDPALDFLLAPDSVAFFHRTYDAGLFWVFAADRYGGWPAIRDVMAASSTYEGRHAVDAAFAHRDLTFDDLWTMFAVALATGSLPDQDVIDHLGLTLADEACRWGDRRTATSASIPTPVYSGTWDAEELIIDSVNTRNDLAVCWNTYPEDPVGSPLRVAHAYGIDVIHIHAPVDRPLRMEFSGDSATAFRAVVATERGGSWTTQSLSREAPVVLASPATLNRIRIVVTRGEAGTGAYSIRLAEN